jgi:hypothetical protein
VSRQYDERVEADSATLAPDWRERFRTTVRMFFDHAGTVLWFVNGPVAYEDSGLPADLIERLRAWEREEDAAFARTDGTRPSAREAADEQRRDEIGLRLAREIADELGDQFAVEFHRAAAPERVILRARHPGSNPAARSAFERWEEADRAEAARLHEKLQSSSDSASFGWFASIGDAEAAAARFYPLGDRGDRREGGGESD